MVDNAKRRRQSGEIPILLKCVACGFFSVVAWLLASSDDIGRGVRIGLYVVSGVSGLCAVVWLLGWVYALLVGIDGDATMLDGQRDVEPDNDTDDTEQVDTPAKGPTWQEIKSGDEEPETTSGAASPPTEPGPARTDSTVDVILGIIADILGVFPHFLAVVTITPMVVIAVVRIVADWLGLLTTPGSTLANFCVILVFLLSIVLSWCWRSHLADRENSRLTNTILVVGSAEFVALVLGTLVLAVGTLIGLG